jgi:hypothetical protein
MCEILHNVSENMLKTFWRLQVYKILLRKVLIVKIEVHEQSLDVKTISWEQYWKDTPAVFQKKVGELYKTWSKYIDNDFRPHFADKYYDSYLSLISDVIEQYSQFSPLQEPQRLFLSAVLGFENTILTFNGMPNTFAAMTSNFRSPLFLSLKKRKYCKNTKNVPWLLPLITAVDNSTPLVFYHYRKQRILKNTDNDMLFFPAVDLNIRSKSFHGLEMLTKNFVLPWDPRIAQARSLLRTKHFSQLLIVFIRTKRNLCVFLISALATVNSPAQFLGKSLSPVCWGIIR